MIFFKIFIPKTRKTENCLIYLSIYLCGCVPLRIQIDKFRLGIALFCFVDSLIQTSFFTPGLLPNEYGLEYSKNLFRESTQLTRPRVYVFGIPG